MSIDLDDIERRMEGAVATLKTDLGGLRTGRASANLLEPIMVEASTIIGSSRLALARPVRKPPRSVFSVATAPSMRRSMSSKSILIFLPPSPPI